CLGVGDLAVNLVLFFFQAEDGIRDFHVTGVQTCALPILTCRLAGLRARMPRHSGCFGSPFLCLVFGVPETTTPRKRGVAWEGCRGGAISVPAAPACRACHPIPR